MIRPPINVEINDDYNFQRVVFLVDRDDFLKDIDLIRKDLDITNIIQYENVIQYLEKLGKKAKKDTLATDILHQSFQDGSSHSILTSSKVVNIVEWLKKKYKKDSSFDMVLVFTIFSGTIKDSEIGGTAYCQYLTEEILKDFHLDSHSQVSIVVTPETREEEVLKIFNTDVRKLFKSSNYTRGRKKTNMQIARDYYWAKKTMTWQDIYNMSKKMVDQTMRSKVRAYSAKLKEKLYSNIPPYGKLIAS